MSIDFFHPNFCLPFLYEIQQGRKPKTSHHAETLCEIKKYKKYKMQNLNTTLLVIFIFIFALTGCSTIEKNKTQIQTKNNVSEKVTSMSDWQIFDEEKSGIKKGVLADFQYPQEWYTYNMAGGTRVTIFFSDGGIYVNQNLSEETIKNGLYSTEYEDNKRAGENECKIAITYDGSNNQYAVVRHNTKNISTQQIDCNSILDMLERQIKKE